MLSTVSVLSRFSHLLNDRDWFATSKNYLFWCQKSSCPVPGRARPLTWWLCVHHGWRLWDPLGPLPIFGLHVFATGWPEISPRGQRQGFCLLFCSLGQWFSHFGVTKVQLGCFLKCLSLLPQRCWVGSPGLQVQWTSRWFWADATVSTLWGAKLLRVSDGCRWLSGPWFLKLLFCTQSFSSFWFEMKLQYCISS